MFCPSILILFELLVNGDIGVAEVGRELVIIIVTTPPIFREAGAAVLLIL
jgi:hypothetical protein